MLDRQHTILPRVQQNDEEKCLDRRGKFRRIFRVAERKRRRAAAARFVQQKQLRLFPPFAGAIARPTEGFLMRLPQQRPISQPRERIRQIQAQQDGGKRENRGQAIGKRPLGKPPLYHLRLLLPPSPAKGTRTVTVVPAPSALANSIVPPCSFTILSHSASPSPAPFCARERDLSTM